MKKFQQIIDLCHQEFGSRVLYTNIEQKETGNTLLVSLDASREEEVTSFYPVIEKGELKVYESWSNTLNLYMLANNQAHFYYQGSVQIDKNGGRYSEPVYDDGLEYEADTAFFLEVNSPEETVEWLRFIFKYRDGSVSAETKSIHVEEQPASRWFEAPRVFLPAYSDKLAPLSKVMQSFNVFNLPVLYDKAYHLGGRNMDEMNEDYDKFMAEIRMMNQEGQAELAETGKVFSALAENSNDRIQPGDFLVTIGGKGKPYTWSEYDTNSEGLADIYFLVLRPAPGISYTAIYEFLFHQMEGLDFVRLLRETKEGMPSTMRFIPDSEVQQQFALMKKTGMAELQKMLNWFKTTKMTPDESLKRIDEGRETLSRLIQHMIEIE